jgi:hypothetical protein
MKFRPQVERPAWQREGEAPAELLLCGNTRLGRSLALPEKESQHVNRLCLSVKSVLIRTGAEVISFNGKPQASASQSNTVAFGLPLNELFQQNSASVFNATPVRTTTVKKEN